MNDPVLNREHLPAGSRVLCALSGGADSVCLLALLRREKDLTVLCAHYNHWLRGEESHRDEAFVKDLCRRWDIPCYTGGGDVAAWAREKGMGIEEAARELRYGFLQTVAAQNGADCIATAHTRNDNAETVLLNMARGTGLAGLGGIPPRRENLVRPLLGVTRQQVEEFLRRENIPWVEDSTNETDDYARNRVRHHLLPELERIHPGAAENIARMTESLREDEAYFQQQAERFLSGCPADRLSVSGLMALPLPVQYRVLARFAGSALSREHRQAILALCRSKKPSGAVDVTGLRLSREYDWLCRGEEESLSLPLRTVTVGETLELPEAEMTLTAIFCPKFDRIQSSFNTFAFSCANICGNISVGSRREGDSLLPAGRKGTRTVKKWMIEAKIPRTRRGLVPVLRDDRGVLAVAGMGQRTGSLPEPGEPCIIIEIMGKGRRTE